MLARVEAITAKHLHAFAAMRGREGEGERREAEAEKDTLWRTMWENRASPTTFAILSSPCSNNRATAIVRMHARDYGRVKGSVAEPILCSK